MSHVGEMSRRIEWSKNEFSYRLPPEPTPVGARRSASRFAVFGQAWLFVR